MPEPDQQTTGNLVVRVAKRPLTWAVRKYPVASSWRPVQPP